MERRVEYVELIDYILARLVSRFIDRGETLEDSAALAEFWCHRIGEECAPRPDVSIREGVVAAKALLHVSAAQATRAYLSSSGQ